MKVRKMLVFLMVFIGLALTGCVDSTDDNNDPFDGVNYDETSKDTLDVFGSTEYEGNAYSTSMSYLENVDLTFDIEQVIGGTTPTASNIRFRRLSVSSSEEVDEYDLEDYVIDPLYPYVRKINKHWFEEPVLTDGYYEFTDLAENYNNIAIKRPIENSVYVTTLIRSRIDETIDIIKQMDVWVYTNVANGTKQMLQYDPVEDKVTILMYSGITDKDLQKICVSYNEAGEEVIEFWETRYENDVAVTESYFNMIGNQDFNHYYRDYNVDNDEYSTQFRGVNRTDDYERVYYELADNITGSRSSIYIKADYGWYYIDPQMDIENGEMLPAKDSISMLSKNAGNRVIDLDFMNGHAFYRLYTSGFDGINSFIFDEDSLVEKSIYMQYELDLISQRGITPLADGFFAVASSGLTYGLKTVNGTFLSTDSILEGAIISSGYSTDASCYYENLHGDCYYDRAINMSYWVPNTNEADSMVKLKEYLVLLGLTPEEATLNQMFTELLEVYNNRTNITLFTDFSSIVPVTSNSPFISYESFEQTKAEIMEYTGCLDEVMHYHETVEVIQANEQSFNPNDTELDILNMSQIVEGISSFSAAGLDIADNKYTVPVSPILVKDQMYSVYYAFKNDASMYVVDRTLAKMYMGTTMIFDEDEVINIDRIIPTGEYKLVAFIGKSSDYGIIRLSELSEVAVKTFDTFSTTHTSVEDGGIYTNELTVKGGVVGVNVTFEDTMPPIIHVGPKVTDENGYLELTTKVVNEYTCYMLVNIISYVEDNVDTEFDFSHYEVYKGEVLLENLNVPIEDGVYFVKVTDSSGNTATLQVTHTNLEE